MSLAEEQITAKNFQEFYSRIRPYLNGSFPTPIVNKFSKGDLYSTEEKIIGQWIDGKPLWQKTVDCGVQSSASTTVEVAHNVSNIGLKFVHEAFMIDTTNNDSNLLPVMNMSASDAIGRIGITDTNITLKQGGGWSNWHAYVVIRYTKTTDSSISIGDGNDYSTDEQVVGTWIDGKPVYQKTVYLSSASQNTEITIENLNVVVDYSGIFSLSGGNQFIMPYGYNGAEDVSMYVRNSDKKIIINSSFALVDLYLTVLYTKSTD